jgi:Flp pilus assembly protein TadD
MFVLRPIVVAMGACLLQACMTTPPAREEPALTAPTAVPAPVAENTELAIQPVMRVRHSADQSAATFYQLGKYHLERGNPGFARSAFEASITLDGQQLEARNALAALDATQGKLDSAKALLIQIVADFPEAAHPHNNLGYVYYLQSDFEAAQKTLQRAIALDAGNERARNNLNAVNIALARLENRDTVTLAMTLPQPASVTQTAQPEQQTFLVSEPVAATGTETVVAAPAVDAVAVTDTRAQGLAIISPPLETQTRMEVVEVVPYVFELKLRHTNSTQLADVKPEKTVPASPVAAVLAAAVPVAPSSASPAKVSRIEVANGNGVTGMAKRISDVLNRQGISVSRLSNELPYKQLETKIQYREGFEKVAAGLKNALKGHAVVVLTPNQSLNADVRLVLGKDAIAHMALIEGLRMDTVLAMNALAD